jgi:hypothetical protein
MPAVGTKRRGASSPRSKCKTSRWTKANAARAASMARSAGESAPVTVVLRASTQTKYAEVVKILKALGETRVSGIALKITGQQSAGVSAVIRARSDAPLQGWWPGR